MKKLTLLVTLLFLICNVCFCADDVIILKSEVRIDSKIESISDTEIRYKKANNLTGPTFITSLKDVSIVILENGEVLSYTEDSSLSQNATHITQQGVINRDTTTISTSHNIDFTPTDTTLMGLSVGFQLKQIPIEDYYGQSDYIIPTFQLGYIVQPEFKYGLGIKTGVNLEIGHISLSEKRAMLDIGISLPLQCSYRLEWFKGFSTLIYTGPIFDFGTCLKIKTGAQPYSEAPDLYSYYGYEGFNCLWGFGIAVQYNGWRFAYDTGIGMVETYSTQQLYDYYGHQQTIDMKGLIHKPMTLSIAYMFNCKKINNYEKQFYNSTNHYYFYL